jgi:RimJ/RimL family protein N-acetyltransferase
MLDDNIILTDFSEEDVDQLMKYWYDSPQTYIESLGVDREKMSARSEFSERLKSKIKQNLAERESRLHYLAIKLGHETIGAHSLSNLKFGESASFHAHIFEERFRGIGVGKTSYPKALKIFFQRFHLKSIEFMTPTKNRAPNKLKESLGIPLVGTVVLNNHPLQNGVEANQYVLSIVDFELIYSKIFSENGASSSILKPT